MSSLFYDLSTAYNVNSHEKRTRHMTVIITLITKRALCDFFENTENKIFIVESNNKTVFSTSTIS